FNSPAFAAADLNTGFIDRHAELVFKRPAIEIAHCLPLAVLFLRLQCEAIGRQHEMPTPWQQNNSWRANQPNAQRFEITMAGEDHGVSIMPDTAAARHHFTVDALQQQFACSGELSGNHLSAAIGDKHFEATVAYSNTSYTLFADQLAAPVEFAVTPLDLGDGTDSSAASDYCAPMNGTVVEVLVAAGSEVAEGDVILVMEAMKMQHSVTANHAGTVTELFYQAGDLVDGGAPLLELAPSEK
ncbi:MAG: hypothetical protein KJP04_07610, partial [Arenicella sp.]|nr:hypothetical protein [Arenicella sp.]